MYPHAQSRNNTKLGHNFRIMKSMFIMFMSLFQVQVEPGFPSDREAFAAADRKLPGRHFDSIKIINFGVHLKADNECPAFLRYHASFQVQLKPLNYHPGRQEDPALLIHRGIGCPHYPRHLYRLGVGVHCVCSQEEIGERTNLV